MSVKSRRPWHRLGKQRAEALAQMFVSNGYGSSRDEVAKNTKRAGENGITAHEIHPYVQRNIQNRRDGDDIFDILPDLAYAASMGTATILSTDDLLTIALIYRSDSKKLSLEMKSRLASKLEDFVSTQLKFNEKLYDIVYKMRYVWGSYPIAILPEASINELINGDIGKVGTERWASDNVEPRFRTVGLLGNPNATGASVGVENYFKRKTLADVQNGYEVKERVNLNVVGMPEVELNFMLTDNIQVLRMPEIKRRRDADIVSKAMMGNENFTVSRNSDYFERIDEEKPDVDLFASKTFKYQHMVALKAANMTARASLNHPTVLDLPPEACLCVHSPGTFNAIIGVLVALDELGHPLAENNHYTTVISNYMRRNVTSDNIDAVAKGMGVAKDRVYEWTERRLADLTRDLVTSKFVNSLKNGNYGHANIQLADNTSFMRTMMAAALSEKRCQLLFIPAEQITYFATDFDSNGTGRSLVEATKILASMRVGNKFASMHAAINNARAITTIEVELDPDMRDPEAHLERVRGDAAKSFNQPLPLTGSADDWNRHLANKGMVFNVQGNEHYPSTKTTVSTDATRYEYPDSDQDEKNATDMYTAFGVNPAAILDRGPVETATQVTVKDLHAAKIAMTEQTRLTPLLTSHIKNYTYSDPILLDMLAKEVEEVLIERVRAKRVNSKRELEQAAKDDAEATDTAAEATPAAPAAPDATPPAGSVEAKLTEDQSDTEFAFENYGGGVKRVARESFVDFYTTMEKVTPDNMDVQEMASPQAIKAIVAEFIATLTVSLPGPENAKLESAMEQLTQREEHYGKMAEWMWPDGLYPDDSELSGKEERLRKLWVSYEMMNYIRNNNICDSLSKLMDSKNDQETLNEMIDDIVDRGIGAMAFIKNISDRLDKQAAALDLIGESSSDTDTSTDTEDDTTDPFNDNADQETESFDFDVGGGETDAGDGQDKETDTTEESTDDQDSDEIKF